ncbi:hypothetical protein [Streptomyces sp. NPDC017260]|uniref:hypothetical protein n=1 Tax=unclassified Streptomyces TaxID=2593676 RepID=UPI00379F38C8
MEQHGPHFCQLGTQLGYYDVRTTHLTGLLRHPDAVEPRDLVPRDIPMRFDRRAMPDVDRWVRRRGSRLLFVNGDQDRPPPSTSVSAPAPVTPASTGRPASVTT